MPAEPPVSHDDPAERPAHEGPAHEGPAHELVDYAELELGELAELAEEGQGSPPRARRWWVLPLRLAISLAMLAVLFRRIPNFEWSALVPDWRSAAPLWLGLALVLTLVGVVLSAARWQQVLHALDIRPRLGHLVSYYFAGQFVSNVLPTTIGGDVLRISRLSKEQRDDEEGKPIGAAETFASVVIERLTGWLVLPVLTFAGLALNPGLRGLDRATNLAVAIALVTLAGLVLILLVAGNPKLGGRLGRKEGWRRFIDAVHLGVARLRARPPTALGVITVGLVYQFVLVLAAAAAAEALGLDIGLTVLLAFYPAVLISQVLPIGISGLGIRESAFVVFLSPLGVQPEQAVALGLLLYLLNLGASLAGAPAFALGARTTR